MPSLYPHTWLMFCVEKFDKEQCKSFIISNDTAKIGRLAGIATGYMSSLKLFFVNNR